MLASDSATASGTTSRLVAYTTIRIGGRRAQLCRARDADDAAADPRRDRATPGSLGGSSAEGATCSSRDAPIDGVVIHPSRMNRVEFCGSTVIAGAGVDSSVARRRRRRRRARRDGGARGNPRPGRRSDRDERGRALRRDRSARRDASSSRRPKDGVDDRLRRRPALRISTFGNPCGSYGCGSQPPARSRRVAAPRSGAPARSSRRRTPRSRRPRGTSGACSRTRRAQSAGKLVDAAD